MIAVAIQINTSGDVELLDKQGKVIHVISRANAHDCDSLAAEISRVLNAEMDGLEERR